MESYLIGIFGCHLSSIFDIISGHSSVSIIFKRKRNLDALLLLSYKCIVSENILLLFLTVPWVGLKCVIVVFPDQTHLLLGCFIGVDG